MMKCPNCYSNVNSSMLKCPRCDWALKTPPPPTSSAAFGESPTANPWGVESKDAPVWQPETQRATPTWDQTPANQPTWDMTAKQAEYDALPAASQAPRGTTPAGGQFQRIPAPAVPTNPGMDAPLPPVTTVPLTGGQKAQLLFGGLLPILVPGGFLIFFFSGFRGISGGGFSNMPTIFLFLIGGLLLFLIYQALKSLRDFASGVALVQTARLSKTSFTRNKNNVSYYGEFAQLGKFRISRDNYNAAMPGALYRISYSPTTKRIWTMALEMENAPLPPIAF